MESAPRQALRVHSEQPQRDPARLETSPTDSEPERVAAASQARRSPTVATATAFVVLGVIIGTWASRIPAVRRSAGLDNFELGFALLAIAAGAVLAMPLVGRLVRPFGSGRLTAVGVAMCCLALPLASFAGGFATLALALLCLGASVGTLDVAMNAHAVAVEFARKRSLLGRFHAGYSVGALAGAGLGALAAAASIGARANFIAVAGACAVVCAALMRKRLLPRGETAGPRVRSKLRGVSRQLLLIGGLAFASLLAEGAATDWSAVYLQGSVKAGMAVGALGYAAFSLMMAAGRLFSDRATERFGAVAVVRSGGLLAAGGLALALISGQAATGVAGFALLGAGLAPIIPAVYRAAANTPGAAPGVGISLGATAGYLGFLLGPPAIGTASRLLGLRGALGIVVLAALVVAAFARATAPGSAPVAGGPAERSCRVL